MDPALLKTMEEKMQKSIEVFKKDLSGIRTGRATPALLDRIQADAYGSPMPLNQLANIAVPDARSMVIQPWDKTLLGAIEKAILKSDIGIHPVNDGNAIRLAIPPLTEERRKDLVKVVKKKSEEGKVSLRNIRREVNDDLKKLEKAGTASEDEARKTTEKVQKITDKYIKDFDEMASHKEREIMEI
ncbi:MAG: ribosome recycling factor [Candidatus Eremiobacteraeota bacterium]|nr:ribosome recycling factor [Candidatus Eremiobacteraeota bacterium]